MGLYKRGKVWWMQFTYKGRLVRKSTEVSDKKLATTIFGKVTTEIAEGKWLDKLDGEDKTFSDLAEKYINDYAKQHKRSWAKDDERLKNHLIPFFGQMIVTEYYPEDNLCLQGTQIREGGKSGHHQPGTGDLEAHVYDSRKGMGVVQGQPGYARLDGKGGPTA